jgi:hypothetical protein
VWSAVLSSLCGYEGPFRWVPIVEAVSGIACLVVHVLESLDTI